VPVEVLLPGALADLVGSKRIAVDVAEPTTVADVLSALAELHPALGRRLCDETGALRRFVNVYVDGDDIRRAKGAATAVSAGAVVQIIPSVAGGA
jgi:molybdopterin converting factor small subunit